ncbi:MAG: sel1 repeat family protein [Telmatospirillum sp.]|nr:sel1 repeat family protein [Telmatospirillum sp.]
MSYPAKGNDRMLPYWKYEGNKIRRWWAKFTPTPFLQRRHFALAIAAFLCLLALAAPVAAGQLEDERDAESRSDWATALKLLRPLAEEGNAVAQGQLGLFYEEGRGVPVDYSEAAKWLRKSADQGNAISQTNLANLYGLGRGVPLDYAESLKWLRKSATQRFYGAFVNLGHVYRHGDGVQIDFVQAYMWYRLASDSATTHVSVRQTADRYLAYLGSKMTREQIAEAERRARDWKP